MTTTITAADFIAALTQRETGILQGNYYQLSFAPAASGPSFGPMQLDIGTNDNAQTAITNILTASGFSADQVSAVIDAAQSITSSSRTVAGKQNDFALQLGGGNIAAGQAIINQINTALAANSAYINAVSSDQADYVAGRINSYFSDINFSGTLDSDVAPLLAELRNQIGNIGWLETTVSGVTTGPTTVGDIENKMDDSKYSPTFSQSWYDNYDASLTPPSGSGDWYVPSDDRSSYPPVSSPISLPTAAQDANISGDQGSDIPDNACPIDPATFPLKQDVPPHFEPLVINLTGSGLANTTSLDQGVQFDLQNNGFAEKTAWMDGGS